MFRIILQVLDGSCFELALEGERLCKAGDCIRGIEYLEAAAHVGTDDFKTLSAIYGQLGTAYFCLQNYEKSLEYHTHDLCLARFEDLTFRTDQSVIYKLEYTISRHI